ncbi:hypothetical protein XF35_35555 [Streptomyces platensis subsp. clarensis]|nr:hypothetical protein [Streptomyces platensis subsp. clarensis]
MSNGVRGPSDAVTDDPARWAAVDRPAVRAHFDATAGAHSVWREVFEQAEAIFGGAEVPPAEFASWLHFAATVLGHDGYAARIAAAEPGMPWRTVWAWWRPAGRCVAQPERLTEYEAAFYERAGRTLLHVETADDSGLLLDLETGIRVPPPSAADVSPSAPPRRCGGDGEALGDFRLSAPEAWAYADPLPAPDGRTWHLVQHDAHGLALLETDPVVLRDWPRGGIDHTSAEEGMPGRVPFLPPSAEPLTASRVDAAFAPAPVVRFPEEALPAGLRDSAARAFLREVGLPKQWRSYKADFVLRPEDEPAEVDESAVAGVRLPDGTVAADLLALGRSVHGALYLHRHDGTVHIAASSAELGEPGPVLVELAPGLEVFTRCLEALRRYLSAVSAPYPGEPDMTEVFAAEMDALAPGLLDPDTPRGVLWSHFTWALTEWDGDLFWLP